MKKDEKGKPRGVMTLLEVAEALYHEEVKEALLTGKKPPLQMLSRERIRQIEKQALKKLRRAFYHRGLSFEDLTSEIDTLDSDEPRNVLRRFDD